MEFDQTFADVQRYAGITTASMPVHVIISELAPFGNLLRRGLYFLQTNHVRAVALDPLAKLSFAGTNSVDVPGGDLHGWLTLVRLLPSLPQYVIRASARKRCGAAWPFATGFRAGMSDG